MLIPASGSPIGVLISGGLDSCILLGSLLKEGHEVQPFYIRCGMVWEPCELSATRQFLAEIGKPRLRPLVVLAMPLHDVYANHWSLTGDNTPDADSPDQAVYLPGRNSLLLVKAAVWAQLHGVPSIALATLGTSPFGDASAEFINRFEAAINCGAKSSVRILLPFTNRDKRRVMELGYELPLQITFSCISPNSGLHCGQCNKCAERKQAFRRAEMTDPTRYAH